MSIPAALPSPVVSSRGVLCSLATPHSSNKCFGSAPCGDGSLGWAGKEAAMCQGSLGSRHGGLGMEWPFLPVTLWVTARGWEKREVFGCSGPGSIPCVPSTDRSPGAGYGQLWFVLGFQPAGLVRFWGCRKPLSLLPPAPCMNSWVCFTSRGFGAVLGGCPRPELKQREPVPFGKHRSQPDLKSLLRAAAQKPPTDAGAAVKNGVCRAQGTIPTPQPVPRALGSPGGLQEGVGGSAPPTLNLDMLH